MFGNYLHHPWSHMVSLPHAKVVYSIVTVKPVDKKSLFLVSWQQLALKYLRTLLVVVSCAVLFTVMGKKSVCTLFCTILFYITICTWRHTFLFHFILQCNTKLTDVLKCVSVKPTVWRVLKKWTWYWDKCENDWKKL